MGGLIGSLGYRTRLAGSGLSRLGRLVFFAFDIIVLSRLLERRHRPLDPAVAALLATKKIRRLPPEITVEAADGTIDTWRHGFSAVNASLFLNLQSANALTKQRHAHPGPPFRAIYLWDSAFIAQVWKRWDPLVAWEVLYAVIEKRSGDRLQHFASEFGRSRLTQPPLVAWSLARLAESVPEEQAMEWIEKAYGPLTAYHRWLHANRRLPNGLFAWKHAYESGVENAPRFSTVDERRLEDIGTWAAPDLCSYMVLHCEALAEMAARLGKDGEAASYADEARHLGAATDAYLWDEEHGLYFDRDTRDGRFIRSHTIASLLPLWAGVPDTARAGRLHSRILSPDAFNTLIPLPSVALDDPDFERDMWRGPVWINTAYAVVEGLRRYGFHETASDFAFRLCDGVYRTFDAHGHFYEFYDPTAHSIDALYRKRGNRWKRLVLGGGPVADFVGWTGLVNVMVADHLFGLGGRPGALTVRPRFPARAAGLRFALALPCEDVDVAIDVLPGGGVRGLIGGPGGPSPFAAGFGEEVALPG
ncbi:hypothetical protein JL100_030530 (plasmid) [Skermanella mucosa]|uniref:MGH1-like glycoside hydrolase domain-containing protein n=1 Tax=Skermanella mucosa TaxID=1789672 RepID=UPI00192CE323|nr:trehalase family glycosidase [Skermanella mucosa]UEM24556.1 hypothetical protein JL100_030530 [Skermanella mucosa]